MFSCSIVGFRLLDQVIERLGIKYLGNQGGYHVVWWVDQEFPALDFFRDALVSILVNKFNLKFFQPVGKGFDTHVLSIFMGWYGLPFFP